MVSPKLYLDISFPELLASRIKHFCNGWASYYSRLCYKLEYIFINDCYIAEQLE